MAGNRSCIVEMEAMHGIKAACRALLRIDLIVVKRISFLECIIRF